MLFPGQSGPHISRIKASWGQAAEPGRWRCPKWTSPIPPLTNPETLNLALRARVLQHQIDGGGGVGLGARWGPGHRSPIIITTTRVRTHEESQPRSHWATSCYRGNNYHPPTFLPLSCLLLLLTASSSSSSVSPPMRRRFAGLCPPSCSFSSITETHSEVGLTKHFPHSLSPSSTLSLSLSLFSSAAEIIQSAELSLLDSFRRYISLPEGEVNFLTASSVLWDFIHFNSVFHSFLSL